MAAPSASGTGIINKPVAYGATSQVTSTNLNAHVDNAVFNANAVSSTINVGDDGTGLFVVDGSITTAKTSFLGTVDVTANSTVRILSKQSDGQYDSVTPSGDVTMSQAGAITIANDAVTTDKILNSNVTLAKVANIADDRVLGNISGGAAAPSELTAANVVTMLGTSLINPTSIDNNTNTITFSNGLILKFGTHTTSGSSSLQTLNFSDHGGNFTNHIYTMQLICTTSITTTQTPTINSQSTSSVVFKAARSSNGDTYGFIALGR